MSTRISDEKYWLSCTYVPYAIHEVIFMDTLGSRLRTLRVERKLTQKEVSAHINKQKNAISNYEADYRLPPTGVLIDLAFFFNVTVDYMLGIDNNHNRAVDNLTDDHRVLWAALDKLEPGQQVAGGCLASTTPRPSTPYCTKTALRSRKFICTSKTLKNIL